MTQKQKDLLLKDLCARLPYGVKVQSYNYEEDIETIETLYEINSDGYMSTIECDTLKNIFKPYLFPLSSMTEEQKKYISDRWGINEEFDFEIDPNWGEYFVELGDTVGFIDWLHENHFDYRGLIPIRLANDATGLNIY